MEAKIRGIEAAAVTVVVKDQVEVQHHQAGVAEVIDRAAQGRAANHTAEGDDTIRRI